MARMKTVRVKPEVYDTWADYSAEYGVTIGEAAAILSGDPSEPEAPVVIEPEEADGAYSDGPNRLATRGDIEELGVFVSTLSVQAQGERGYLAEKVDGDPQEMETRGRQRVQQMLEDSGYGRREARAIAQAGTGLPKEGRK